MNSSTVKHSQFTRIMLESSKVSHGHKLLHNWNEPSPNTNRFCRQILGKRKLAVIMHDFSLSCFAIHKFLLLKLQKADKNCSVLVRFGRCQCAMNSLQSESFIRTAKPTRQHVVYKVEEWLISFNSFT